MLNIGDIAMDYKKNFIGFDNFFEDLEKITKPHSFYPPYEILEYKDSEGCTQSYQINIAAAGINIKDIDIRVECKQDLIISYKNDEEQTKENSYVRVYGNLAKRSFKLKFKLQESKVDKAWMQDGLLCIKLLPCQDVSVEKIKIQ